MYAKVCATTGGVAGIGLVGYEVHDLPWPLSLLWHVVMATTLIAATLALLRLLPRGRGRS